MMHSISLCLLLCITLSSATFSVLLDTGNYTSIEAITVQYFNTSTKEFSSGYFFVNGSIAMQDDDDVMGKIVVMSYLYGVDGHAKEFQERGAIAVVMGSDFIFPGKSGYVLNSPREFVTDLPTAEISDENYMALLEFLEGGDVVWATLEWNPATENPYYEPMQIFGTFAQIAGVLFFGPILICAIVLLVIQLKYRLEVNIRVLILCTIIISTIIRLCYTVINPSGSQRTTSWPFNIFIHLFNIPLALITELLVSIFWFSIMAGLFKEKKFLTSTRVPFIIIVIIFTVLISITAIIVAIDPDFMESMVDIAGAVYALCILVLSVFHFVTAVIFYRKIGKIKKKAQLKKNNLVFIVKVFFIVAMDILTLFVVIFIVFAPAAIFFSLSAGFSLIVATGFHSIAVLTLFNWDPSSFSTSRKSSVTTKTK